MNTATLKESLISKISEIEDLEVLKALETILMYSIREPMIRLTADQEAEILVARDSGYSTQADLDEKVGKWLSEDK